MEEKPRLKGGNPNFAPGEGEELVRELRSCLRLEEQLRAEEQLEAAAFQAKRAESIAGELASRLEQRFLSRAKHAFWGRGDLIDQAVSEMFTQLWLRVNQTDDSYSIMETRFNVTVMSLMVDAVRLVRSQNGLVRLGKDAGKPATKGYSVISLEQTNEQASTAHKGERKVKPLQIVDPDAEEPFDRIVSRALGAKLMKWLDTLPERERVVVQARTLDGHEWSEVARQANVSVSTAQSDHKNALGTLRALYAEEQARYQARAQG